MIGHARQARERLAQVGQRIDAAAAAAFHDGVEDGSAFTGIGGADEQPVLLADGGGPDRVFHPVVIDLNAAVRGEALECRPLLKDVGDRFPHCALRQEAAAQLYQGSTDPLEDGRALPTSDCFPQCWSSSTGPELSLDPIELADLVEQPGASALIARLRLKDGAPRVSPAARDRDRVALVALANERRVGRIAVALHDSAPVAGQHGLQTLRGAAGLPLEDRVAAWS